MALFAQDGGEIVARGGQAAGGQVAVETKDAHARLVQTKLKRGWAGLAAVAGEGSVEIEYQPAARPSRIRRTADGAQLRVRAADAAEELADFGLEPVALLAALVRWLLRGRLAPVAASIELEVDELGVTLSSPEHEALCEAELAIVDAIADMAPPVLAQLQAVAAQWPSP